jgi:glycosyltransferase involved in cell wall biosynthesis
MFNNVTPNLVLVSHEPSIRLLRYIKSRARQIGAKTIFDVRTLPTGEHPRIGYKRLGDRLYYACGHFDGITYITEEIRRYCIRRYQLPEHPYAVWTSGVNGGLFCPGFDAAVAEAPFRLIYHGGIISVGRGLDSLIRAIDLVRDLPVHLTLISSLREPAVIESIDKLCLHDKVSLMETIPHAQVPGAIRECHAGVLPFPNRDVWNTSSPIKLFEYLACGKPVIVTDIPAHRNVVGRKTFAFFASDSSPAALAGAIRKAYAARGSFTELGHMARREVLEHHTWGRQAERLGVFLKEVSACGGSNAG